MKKRNTTSLRLRKNSISNLESRQLKGGTILTDTCTSVIDDCPSAWFCPTDIPTLCNIDW
ncbi:hypothetical protein KORDIASMS9_01917 [Kordia sp. SMS9]|uniref:hypothetical protein n=1 Tax=Kordia sp. SMS9 TaxID=2282170 RepID=UPI000E109D6B|nr:hypothetical protein [Kordia sp. SMS9]AXG69690.1 hypothetical protein KORDIASMS9_01917 [Kordia sp. SMS9]